MRRDVVSMDNKIDHACKCLLRHRCRAANSEKCHKTCASFVSVHGLSGTAGMSGNAYIPRDYRLLTVGSKEMTSVKESQPKLASIIESYIDTFSRVFSDEGSEPIKSLYLYSRDPGTGKTTTASALLNEFISVVYIGSLKRNLRTPEHVAYFLDVNAWQTLYNEFNRPHMPESVAEQAASDYYGRMKRAESAMLTVFDDIGVRNATDAFRADLHDVINKRVTAGLPSIYTSNIPLLELNLVFDDRLADRIRDRCVEIKFSGKSNRGVR